MRPDGPRLAPDVTSAAGDTEDDLRWLWRIWAVVAAFAVLALARSHQVGIPLRDPHGSILRNRLALSLALMMVLVPVEAALRARRGGGGLRDVPATVRARWTARRTTLTVTVLVAYHLVYFCYHNLKSWDVLNRPRDGMLLAWDRWLFLGHSPAVLLHDLFGQHLAAYVLLVVYESFSTLLSVSLVVAVVFPRRIRDGSVFVAAAIWVWILGTASYYLIPSLGPFHSAPGDFAGLPHTLVTRTQSLYLAQRSHLLAHPEAPDAFAQVSAFASLHVAVTTMILLVTVLFRLRVAAYALSVFLVGTLLATVYLGWHFAVDDAAGLLIAVVGVWLGRLVVGFERPSRPPWTGARP